VSVCFGQLTESGTSLTCAECSLCSKIIMDSSPSMYASCVRKDCNEDHVHLFVSRFF
jgi:hypothetical protein